MDELQLIDIADDLVVLNRNTLETLIHLDKADNCIALYVVYYRLAKWQKTNKIKATDEYIRKTLHWGKEKIARTKNVLKNCGLIEIIQQRNESKIIGWFVKINYIISENTVSKIKVEQEVLNQEVLKSISTEQDTIALRNNINCLKNKIQLLEEENKILKEKIKESENLSTPDEDKQNEIDEHNFKIFWDAYPRKEGRTKAFGYFKQWVRGRKINGKIIKLTDMQVYEAVLAYAKEKKYTEPQYIQQGSTFFNTTILDYVDME